MKNTIASIGVFTFLFTTGCFGGGGGGGGGVTGSREQAEKVFNTSNLTCANLDCAESAGGLIQFTVEKDEAYVAGCTMTLIGSDRVLTNKHCIPSDIWAKGLSCQGRIKFRFPKIKNKPFELFECDRVLDLSAGLPEDNNYVNPDWAILKMAGSTSRTPAQVESTGIDVAQSVTLYPSYYQGDITNYNGELRKVTCQTDEKILLVNYFDAFSPTFSATQCSQRIVHGNSGSGVFLANGLLAGVVSDIIEHPAIVDGHFAGTNLSCVSYFNSTPDGFCKSASDDTFNDSLSMLKIYSLMNRTQYYSEKTSDDLWAQPSEFLQLGPIPLITEMGTAYKFDGSVELENEFYKHFADITFKYSSVCIQRSHADNLVGDLDVMDVLLGDLKPLSFTTPVPLFRHPVTAFFSRKDDDTYNARISILMYSDEDNNNVTQYIQWEKDCLDPDKSGGPACQNWRDLHNKVLSWPYARASTFFNNVFLKHLEVREIQFEVPICPY